MVWSQVEVSWQQLGGEEVFSSKDFFKRQTAETTSQSCGVSDPSRPPLIRPASSVEVNSETVATYETWSPEFSRYQDQTPPTSSEYFSVTICDTILGSGKFVTLCPRSAWITSERGFDPGEEVVD
eukprot:Hpha_TRINITY_DN25984_c0_g1::TRINITY_DN25984_c0_g1_i1::g.185266::m.185266